MSDRSIVLYSGTTKSKKPRKVFMTQAIANLLRNAVKYTRPRDPAEIPDEIDTRLYTCIDAVFNCGCE